MNIRSETMLKTHSFTLVYTNAHDLPENFDDLLFEQGCDDSTVCTRDRLMILGFDREASTFREALLSAIDAVERCQLPVQLIRVEPD